MIESDGTPVSGMDVELVEVGIAFLLAPERRVSQREGIRVSRAVSGPDGRFELTGARPAEGHALAIDPGGARSTLRVLERSLAYSGVIDLGDFVLAEGGTVTGRVLGEDGEPVANARVRLAALPDAVVQSGVLDFRAGCMPVRLTRDGVQTLDLPEWVSSLIEDLPVSTGWSGEDGRFRLVGVPVGRLAGGVDCAGMSATPIPSFALLGGDDHDLGELELLVGRTATGRVLDAGGAPVEGALVQVGAIHPALKVGFLQPTISDHDGRFEVPGIPAAGETVAYARRSTRDPWVSSVMAQEPSALDVVLAPLGSIRLNVVDELGEGVAGATVRLVPARAGDDRFQVLLGVWRWHSTAIEASPGPIDGPIDGAYEAADAGLGEYACTVEAPGFGASRRLLAHSGMDVAHRVVLRPGAILDVQVLDGSSGTPVENAHVSVIGQDGWFFGSMGDAWTTAAGEAQVRALAKHLWSAPQGGATSEFPLDHSVLSVEHPGYGHHSQRLDLAAPSHAGDLRPSCTVTLWPASSLRGSVRWDGHAPGQTYAVTMERVSAIQGEKESFNELPRTTVTDPGGAFEIRGLSAGSYRLKLADRALDGDFLRLAMAPRRAQVHYLESLEIRPGEEQTALIQMSSAGAVGGGWIEGHITMNGQPLVGAEVRVMGADPETLITDGGGRFVSAPVDRPSVGLTIGVRLSGADGQQVSTQIHSESVPLSHGQGAPFALHLVTHEIEIEVRDAATGDPLQGVLVHSAARLGSLPAMATTTQGRASLTVHGGTSIHISAMLEGYPFHSQKISASDLVSGQRQQIELYRGVPCSGHAIAPDGMEFGVNCAIGLDSETGELPPQQRYIIVEKGSHTFSVLGLPPGTYTASLLGESSAPSPVLFELPEGGASDLVLDFKSGTSR